MNAEPRLWWSLFDENVAAARERKVLRKESTADDLIPAERLDFLASVTTTQYITLGRTRESGGNGPVGGRGSTPEVPVAPAAQGPSVPGHNGSTIPPPSSPGSFYVPSIEPPQQDDEGMWYFTCAQCGKRKKWAPKGASAGKAPWPGATCWDCYKETKR